MNLKITGIHLEVTPSLREYIEAKLERITRHVDNVTSVAVTLSVEKLEQKAEVNVHLKGKDIHVEATSTDMYAALDALDERWPSIEAHFNLRAGEDLAAVVASVRGGTPLSGPEREDFHRYAALVARRS